MAGNEDENQIVLSHAGCDLTANLFQVFPRGFVGNQAGVFGGVVEQDKNVAAIKLHGPRKGSVKIANPLQELLLQLRVAADPGN